MSDLLARLKAGQSAIGCVHLGELEFGLRLLTEQDYMDASFAVDAAMKAANIELSMATSELFESEKSSQLLLRALVDVDANKPVASNAKQLREAISRDQKNLLIEAYLSHEKAYSPSERNMSDEDFAELIEEVKKNPTTPLLNDSSTVTLKRLITTLALPPTC
ncbi:hypothetical protein [Undibacterium sp.]|uniref:hypothetical protein n=1 Tax=Undibacterium sp. TaxID=1914977 RepID=UPI0025EEF00B|nr:hypothetical protein [Undibacterium sp.]